MLVQCADMKVDAIHTPAIRANEQTLANILDTAITAFHEHEILVVTSKVVSLCEGNVVPSDQTTKDALVQREADYYLPAELNLYGFHISIKNHTLIASAGIDESNGDGNFILWPKDIQKSANTIREYLCNRFGLTEVGVLITDSHVLPLRWGTVGTALAHSGFEALNNYIGTPDLFGRKLKVTYSNVAEGLAGASVVCMGEGNESTPLAVVSDVPFVHFQDRNPTTEELDKLAISKEEDIFSPLFQSVEWKKGK